MDYSDIDKVRKAFNDGYKKIVEQKMATVTKTSVKKENIENNKPNGIIKKKVLICD